MRDRRAVAIEIKRFRPGPDQILVVVRLELVRLFVDGDETSHAVVRHPRCELLAHGHRHPRRVPAGAAPGDLDAPRVHRPMPPRITRRRGAAYHLAPAP